MIMRLLYPEKIDWRPKTREDCAQVMRPCPYVGCRYHLYLDVSERQGSIRVNYEEEVWDLTHSCSLDIADEGGHTLQSVADILRLTRERVRQLEKKALEEVGQDGEIRTFGPSGEPSQTQEIGLDGLEVVKQDEDIS